MQYIYITNLLTKSQFTYIIYFGYFYKKFYELELKTQMDDPEPDPITAVFLIDLF